LQQAKMRSPLLLLALIIVLEESNTSFVLGFGISSVHTNLRSAAAVAAPPSSCWLAKHDRSSLETNVTDIYDSDDAPFDTVHRRSFLSRIGLAITTGLAVMQLPDQRNSNNEALAAPPIAVIAEELGYFPVTSSKNGETMYIPKRVQRASSEQAIALAKKLADKGVVMYGAFWCPHCARQKELFGREAFQYITYVECAPRGYSAQPLICNSKNVDGYPTWVFRDKTVLSGERPLDDFAKQVNFKFDPKLEKNVPPPLGGGSCN